MQHCIAHYGTTACFTSHLWSMSSKINPFQSFLPLFFFFFFFFFGVFMAHCTGIWITGVHVFFFFFFYHKSRCSLKLHCSPVWLSKPVHSQVTAPSCIWYRSQLKGDTLCTTWWTTLTPTSHWENGSHTFTQGALYLISCWVSPEVHSRFWDGQG